MIIRILGIDYGDSRIGTALSDPLLITAGAHKTLPNDGQHMNEILNIIKEYKVEKIVLGLPKNMDGSLGFRSEITMQFKNELEEIFEGEIILWDERLSTVSAIRVLNETNVRGKKRKNNVDKIAAVYILQSYLDSKR